MQEDGRSTMIENHKIASGGKFKCILRIPSPTLFVEVLKSLFFTFPKNMYGIKTNDVQVCYVVNRK